MYQTYKKQTFLALGIILTSSLLLLNACAKKDSADRLGSCFGQVLDADSFAGIAGAKVEIVGGDLSGGFSGFSTETTTSKDDKKEDLIDEAGFFRFTGLPSGTSYAVVIAASGYATTSTTCTLGTAQASDALITDNVGGVALTEGKTVTATLKGDSKGLEGCLISAIPVGGAGVRIIGLTDSSGSAQLEGLDANVAEYEFGVDQCDTDNDGKIDFDFSHTTKTLDEAVSSGVTFNVTLK